MPQKEKVQDAVVEITSEEIDVALARLVASELFSNSERLKSFLTYVVAESVSGRASEIKGKTIAQDVYGRDAKDFGASVVRVDAGRLRGKLLEYYSTVGAEEPVRIYIDSGQYAPRFERRSDQTRSGSTTSHSYTPRPKTTVSIVAGAAVLCGGLVLFFWATGPRLPASTSNASAIERQALFENAPATLQAINLTKQGNGLLFPLADFSRQKLATATFKEAINIDENFAGSYAGAAHSLGTLAILAPKPELRETFLEEAQSMAAKALELNAKDGWSQSAASWVAVANRDYGGALRLSNRAFALNPTDGNVLDFHALVHLLTGQFEKAREIADPNRERNIQNTRVVHRNAYGVASFHLGFFDDAIDSFQLAAELGDPVSELSLMFAAASHQGAGRNDKAVALVDELRKNWPNFRPDIALPKFYQHQEHADEVLDLLHAAGWNFTRKNIGAQ